MKARSILTAVATVILPATLFAATDCRFIELPDRFEVVCVGDEQYRAESHANIRAMNEQLPLRVFPATIPNNPVTAAAASAAVDRSTVTKPAVKQLIAYRQHKLQRSDVEAKKAFRLQQIRADIRNQPVMTNSPVNED